MHSIQECSILYVQRALYKSLHLCEQRERQPAECVQRTPRSQIRFDYARVQRDRHDAAALQPKTFAKLHCEQDVRQLTARVSRQVSVRTSFPHLQRKLVHAAIYFIFTRTIYHSLHPSSQTVTYYIKN